MTLFAADSGAQLPVLAEDGRFAGVVRKTITEVEIALPPLRQNCAAGLPDAPQPLLDGDLLFLGQEFARKRPDGQQPFAGFVFGKVRPFCPTILQLQFWAEDTLLAERPLSQFSSGQWQAGQVIQEKYTVPVPAELAAGNL
ncbi:MAG: hypothetical protein H6656_13745 [Ardenticatenaceae bacterium]|nr:hypothetical protein [Ardenticatenaceae bacterium]